MSANGVRTNLLAADKNATQLLDILRTNLTHDGLSGSAIQALATEAGMGRTAYYNAIKTLVERNTVKNIGTEKRTHYVLTSVIAIQPDAA